MPAWAMWKPAARLADLLSDVLEMRRSDRPGLTLIRPDGYVAYAARSGLPSGLKAVRTLLARQTRSPGVT
jgi:hypothetical protein